MRERRTKGRIMSVRMYEYPCNKYFADTMAFDQAEVSVHEGMKYWETWSGADAKEIEESGILKGIDDEHEYLVLYFENGTTKTFRNSYVDMFAY